MNEPLPIVSGPHGPWEPERLVPGASAGFSEVVTAELHQRFADLSGDHSPIHSDQAFAARTRFGRIIGHAALLHALVSRLYGHYLPGGNSICLRQDARYLKPFFCGDRLTVTGTVDAYSPATGVAGIRVRIVRDDDEPVFDGMGTIQVCFGRAHFKPLYIGDAGPVFAADFIRALQDIGIKTGDAALVHSDITVFGRLAESRRDHLLGGLGDAICAAFGTSGTVLMPVFTYSPCRDQVFDPDCSASTVGVLTESFRHRPGVLRGKHPIFSFAGWGAKAAELIRTGPDAFGADSVFEHLEREDAWLVFFGAPVHSMTYVHRVEQMSGCDYRFLKTFPSVVREKGVETRVDATFFCRHLDRDVVLDLKRLEAALQDAGALRSVRVGDGFIRAVRCQAVTTVAARLLAHDPYALLAHPPRSTV